MRNFPLPPKQALADWALDSAYERYPLQWYQSRWLIFVVAPVGIGLIFKALTGWQPQPSPWKMLVGIAVYIVGWFYDNYTTRAVLDLKPEFDRRGVEFPTKEENPFLPPYQKQPLVHPMALVALPFLVFSFWYWWIGLVLGVPRLIAAMGNWRVYRQLRFTLHRFDEQKSC